MYVGKILSTLGGQGPTLLVISLCAGLLINPLAHLGYEILPLSALGSFLTAGLAPSEAKIRLSLMALVVGWVGLALPLGIDGTKNASILSTQQARADSKRRGFKSRALK